MAHPQEIRDKLRRLYVVEQQPLETAALICGVSAATARKWKYADRERGRDWDKERGAHLMAGGRMETIAREVVARFLVKYEYVMRRLDESDTMQTEDIIRHLVDLADAFSKMTAASRKVLPETDKLSVGLDVLILLGDHVREKYPQHTAAFVDVLEGFANVLPEKLKG